MAATADLPSAKPISIEFTMPIWTTVLAVMLFGERLTVANAVGITVAYFTIQPDYVNIANVPLQGWIAVILALAAADEHQRDAIRRASTAAISSVAV